MGETARTTTKHMQKQVIKLVRTIILANNYGRETFKERLKSVKEAYVQRVSEAKESDGKKE